MNITLQDPRQCQSKQESLPGYVRGCERVREREREGEGEGKTRHGQEGTKREDYSRKASVVND